MKYWGKLLLSQRAKGNDGLTIPYIIGSQDFLNINSKDNIEQLIVDIIKNSPFEITLKYCLNLQTLILEIRKNQNFVYYPKYKNEMQSNFSVSKSFYNDSWQNCEDIITELVNQFENKIRNKTFSAQPNPYGRTPNWTTYSETEDIPFIMEALNKENYDLI